jgi:hypothetical protein
MNNEYEPLPDVPNKQLSVEQKAEFEALKNPLMEWMGKNATCSTLFLTHSISALSQNTHTEGMG